MICDQERYDMIYRQMISYPDFPQAKAERLMAFLPTGSRDLAAEIYLLPFGEAPSENALAVGAAVNALLLFCLVQNDMTVNRVFGEEEAVLYGDYLFALCLFLLPRNISVENRLELIRKIGSNNERRYLNHKLPVTSENALAAVRSEHGGFFRGIAEHAMAECNAEAEIKAKYLDCAEAIGTLWGVLYEGYSCSLRELKEEIAAMATGLPMEKKLLLLIDNWRVHDFKNQ